MTNRSTLSFLFLIGLSLTTSAQNYVNEARDITRFAKFIRMVHTDASEVTLRSDGQIVIGANLDKKLREIAGMVKELSTEDAADATPPDHDGWNDSGTTARGY